MADVASAEETTQKALEQLNLSIEDDTKDLPNGSLPNGVNGKTTPSPRHSGEHGSPDRTVQLQKELERTKQEKEALSTQYQNLVTRLNNMRTTLGNKLKQDAVSPLSRLTLCMALMLSGNQEELDRREQLIQQLTAQNDDLSASISTLQSEIVTSNTEAERASKELETLRSRTYEENTQETLVRERELRELQVELERCRMERDEWERDALEGKVTLDEAKAVAENYSRDLQVEREARERMQLDLEAEREKSGNLQAVLEDFQSGMPTISLWCCSC